MKSAKKTMFNAVFLVVLFSITIYYVFSGKDLTQILNNISNANIAYWVFAVFLVIAFILSESVIIHYLMNSLDEPTRLSHCFLYSFVGFFFSCITPSASGGQPAQLVYMKRDGLSFTKSIVVLMIVTTTYKAVLVFLGAVIFIIQPPSIMRYLAPVYGWCILGMTLNVVCIVFILLAIFKPFVVKWTAYRCVFLGERLHIVKNTSRILEKVDSTMSKYKDVSDFFKDHHIVVVNAFVITIFQRIMIFLVTYLVCASFDCAGEGIITITGLQGMISVAVDMLPLPGGMGVTEALFNVIFEPVLNELTTTILVISRGLSYYTELLLSFIFTVAAHVIIGRNKGSK